MKSSPLLALLTAIATPIVVQAIAVEPRSQNNQMAMKNVQDWSYERCGTNEDIVTIDTMTVSPNPPIAGQDMTITATGVVGQRIEDGAYANVIAKVGLITLKKSTYELCDVAVNLNTTIQCPVESGSFTLEYTVSLSDAIPPAKYSFYVDAFTVDDNNLFCFKVWADFTPPRLWMY